MARPERYDPDQWQLMNKPEVQARIRKELLKYIGSFLDSAPDGGELERASIVLSMLRKYFERELQLAKEDGRVDSLRSLKAEEFLSSLSFATRFLRTDAAVDELLEEIRRDPPASPKQIEEWRKVEERLRREGKEHWWD